MNFRNLQVGQTIAFDYARRTKSGLSSRIGEVVKVGDTYVDIEETISPTEKQYRRFSMHAIVNALVE